ncbi:hypothetical protein PHYSODRAFT_252719 [Phytophthora sojae]|uniref:Uncharacterized protein n=1 Tax=Phytophthora sojae (strain P6497) TaxID=1094619 RepID=G5A7F8_PHYSP|nr:hypothetical protein PHYSODRAFT_252719 [Phytophthora sojae]EGZ07837.1 hypothetical protein PHYSODRAFT_252719 [Phytophthora sojae]|eukprot:XP_009536009.1 hypothetical protein PHYSODRAFT_252719 [Phytophthora sojae]
MGRRGVQQLTPAQWREALEQQIREKQQQKEEVEQPQRWSQSAPQQVDGEQLAMAPGLERAATTGSGETGEGQAVGGRRRVWQQSREDYLRGLQEQIEEKKRLAEEQRLKEQQSRRRRRSRSEDDDGKLHSDLQQRLEDAKATASSNQLEVDPCPPPVLKAEVAADPVVITKIVDFCEELKKQNEDVKRQLLEQHATSRK